MEQNQAKYTVFFGDGWCACNVHMRAGASLQELIDHWAHMSPRAWAAEWVDSFGGAKSRSELEAESIAAGRLIEKVGDKYVARGMEEASKQNLTDLLKDWVPFSVRNGYREKKLPELTWADTKPVDRFPGFSVTSGSSDVLHTLADGVHPLQKMAEGKDGFGSAFLIPDKR